MNQIKPGSRAIRLVLNPARQAIVNDIDFCTLTAGWQVSTMRTKEAMRALVTEDNEVMAVH